MRRCRSKPTRSGFIRRPVQHVALGASITTMGAFEAANDSNETRARSSRVVDRLGRALDDLAPPVATRTQALTLAAVFLFVTVMLFVALRAFVVDFGLDLSVYHGAERAAWGARDVYGSTYSANALPFAYPPSALLILTPLAMPLPLGQVAAYALSICALLFVVRLLVNRRRTWAAPSLTLDARAVLVTTLLFPTFPVLLTLHLGQVIPASAEPIAHIRSQSMPQRSHPLCLGTPSRVGRGLHPPRLVRSP